MSCVYFRTVRNIVLLLVYAACCRSCCAVTVVPCITRAIRLVPECWFHSLQVIERLSKLIGLVDMPQSPYWQGQYNLCLFLSLNKCRCISDPLYGQWALSECL
jgi:hypothetical protein